MSEIDPLERLLSEANKHGGYPASLVCTDEGLLIAAAGEGMDSEQIAAITSLFDEIVVRARRDVGLGSIDEVTLRDQVWGRCVVRPINDSGEPRFFLVVRVPNRATWRRNTTQLCRALRQELVPLLSEESP